MNNDIDLLFDIDYIKNFLAGSLSSSIHNFKEIVDIKIVQKKNLILRNYYHLVIEYKVKFLKTNGVQTTWPIYATAHSNEQREIVYNNLKFLIGNGLSRGEFKLPDPLFFSKKFNATFYHGLFGHSLYYYISKNKREQVEKMIPKTAAWFYLLHQIPQEKFDHFGGLISSIQNVIPGSQAIISKVKNSFPAYGEMVENIYAELIKSEKIFFEKNKRSWVIHGDAHPENIINYRGKIGIIDFADLCLSDFARDLGSFMQQLNYMVIKKIQDQKYADHLKDFFLDSYIKQAGVALDDHLKERVNMYYNWTKMRTATYFLIRHDPAPEKAEPLIRQVCENLNIKYKI